ncbi:hypothetical protein JOC34_003665 [Virgibacillus halotolerans]|uniref:AimR family lysis-lysogeny pheromone receptor n=1 Tax=Virgibacillus halotolerans TaxID=1071053 RepID=UPI001960E9AE|nr:AimR family lysis-lysogeny pheromone receptor [Virgibacillus halotolerans]MBM7601244.1 hypothetical protein [Virgibacillus halotolerans]
MLNLLDNVNKQALTLKQLMEILKQKHNHQQVIELMKTYCLELPSLSLMKTGMEFLYINGFYDDLQQLIEKNEQSDNPSNRQWAAIYQLIIDRRMNRYSPHQLLQTINRMNTTETELRCLIEFVKVTAYYDLNQFNQIGNFLHRQQFLMEAIEDSLLVSYFNIRLHHIMLTYYLIRNELIMARKHAFRVLNLTDNPRTKASIHIKLALSYTFDTYEQGMYHLEEALKISRQNQLDHITHIIKNHNIPFLSAHFNRIEDIITDDKSEQAHIEMVRGNNQKAIEILNELPMDSPFQLYYMGKVKLDRDLLLQSYNLFIQERSDYFFSRLPLLELKRIDNESI